MRAKDLRTWWTPAQVSKRLDVSRQHLHRLCEDGKIRGAVDVGSGHRDLGRSFWAIPPETVEELVGVYRAREPKGEESKA